MIRRGSHDASQSFDDAWQRRESAQHSDPEIRELVRTAELICRAAVAEPSAEFRTALRERLMVEASEVLVPLPAERPVRPVRPARRRRVAAATAAALVGLGTVGTVSSSASAVPGDLLYPVKRGVENVQVTLHRDDASRGEYRLQQARERLAEARHLDRSGDTARLADTLDDFASQTEAGSDRLFAAYESDQSTERIDTVNDFVAEASVELAGLSGSVPPDARSSFDSAATLVGDVASQASSLCGTCSTADVRSLVDAVQSLADDPIVPTAEEKPAVHEPAKAEDKPAPKATTGTTGSASGSGSGTGGVLPTTPPPTKAPPTVTSVVGDTVDALLGDEGLVPNLLGGLLGTKK